MKLFNKTIDNKLFKQYSFGSDLSKQKVVAKIFNPYGRGTWYILNSDPNDPDYLWAIVDLGYGAEVGSVSRKELETYRNKLGYGFERDMYFDEINAKELYNGLLKGEFYNNGGGINELKIGQKYKAKNGDILTIKDFDVADHVTTDDGKGKMSSMGIQRISVFKELIKDGELIHLSENGSEISSFEQFINKEIQSQKEKEKDQNFKLFRVNVYEQNENKGAYPFVEPYHTDNFVEALNFAKETIKKQRSYRGNSGVLWTTIDSFTPIEKRENVRYPYSELIRFDEENINTSKFNNGGYMTDPNFGDFQNGVYAGGGGIEKSNPFVEIVKIMKDADLSMNNEDERKILDLSISMALQNGGRYMCPFNKSMFNLTPKQIDYIDALIQNYVTKYGKKPNFGMKVNGKYFPIQLQVYSKFIQGSNRYENKKYLLLYSELDANYSHGGEVSFIDYKDSEIMYEPNYKKYYANDVEFDSLQEAKDFLDSGEIDPSIRDAYKRGIFATGGGVDKEFEVYRNGTQQGRVFAKNLKEAEKKVFAQYGKSSGYKVYEAEDDEDDNYATGGGVDGFKTYKDFYSSKYLDKKSEIDYVNAEAYIGSYKVPNTLLKGFISNFSTTLNFFKSVTDDNGNYVKEINPKVILKSFKEAIRQWGIRSNYFDNKYNDVAISFQKMMDKLYDVQDLSEIKIKLDNSRSGNNFATGGGVGEKYLVDGDRVLNTETNMYVDYDFETKERAEYFAKTKNDRIKEHGVDYEIGGQLEMKFLKGGKLESKIQKKVDEVNSLIEKAIDSDGDPIMVVDKSGTWEEPMIYKPVSYRNGRLYFEYYEPYSDKTKKEVVNKSNIDFDGYPMLLDIAKMYRRALKEKGVSYAGGGKTGKLSFDDWMKKNNIEVYKRTYYWVADDGKGDYLYSGTKAEVMKSLREDYKKSYEGGGKTTFKEKATAIAKNFEGKKVEPKYQKEYGKTYDKAEAKEVGNKIAGSQKAKYDSKMSGGGSTKRGGAMQLAKQIRKDGESWQSALKRANEQMRNK